MRIGRFKLYDVAIIGAGVIGSAIARELSKYELGIVVLDKENDASIGTSKANSGIIHAGYDPMENTMMAKLNAQANPMFDRLCDELDVPFKRVGSLVVAFDDEQLAHIEELRQRGVNNGIPDLRILSQDELLKKEPNINPEARGALYAPTAGIIDSMLLTISLLENAVSNGAEAIFNYHVESIDKTDSGWRINSQNRSIEAKTVINAAGLYADNIHDMVLAPAFRIAPVRGQYFLLDKSEAGVVNSVVFPCPTKAGKGTLVAPTVHDNVIVGPTFENITDKEDVSTDDEMLWNVTKGARRLIPGVGIRNSIRNFSGLRAEADTGDFVIGEVEGASGFINAAGTKSPGLTAAPAIAKYVASMLKGSNVSLELRKSFDPIVRRKLLCEMPENDQIEVIKQNPIYGRVVCRCENITEGDIVDSIRRNPGAVTLDGVKRRSRAGMGRCQGGFCSPKVQHILADELKKPLEEIVLEKNGSYILTGRTK